ncbi:MAG: ABC transporter permease [Deltaproteobacteria bacterium]|nr:MAG: ABC transporter permease [Deltaproteobacteria bacterium]
MYLFRLAFKNLWRSPGRNALTTIAVVAGVWMLILGQGFIGGFKENIIRAQVDTVSGHLFAVPSDYPTTGLSHPIDELVEVDADDVAWLDANTRAWTKRTLFTPRVISGADGIRARGIVIDWDKDPTVFDRRTWNVSPEDALDEPGVLLSKGVARLLEVGPGDAVTLEARTHSGQINALRVQVRGVVSVANPMIDNLGIFVDRELGEDLLRLGGKASHVVMMIDDRDATAATKAAIGDRFGDGVDIVTWQEETKELLDLQEIRQRALNFLVLALLAMSGAGIANTVLMAAYERVGEIGTLRAMGMTQRDVLGLFLIEGGLVGVLGSVLGVVLGASMVGYWSVNPIDLSGQMDQIGNNIPVSTFLWTVFEPSVLVRGFFFGVIMATLASVYPARVASNMSPADAVRA